MTNHTLRRSLLLPAVLAAFALLTAACASDDGGAPELPAPAPAPAPATQADAAPEPPPPAAESETTPEPEPAPPPPAEPEATPEPPPPPPPEPAPVEATGEPILVGNISSLTGGALFPEASAAAKAVFDRVNAAGGISGRPIELIIEDDGGTPEGAATAARKLVEQDDVVAMVGSASTLECVVNAGLYAEAGVYSIQGTGVDPLCFLSPNISPVNTGPYAGITVSLYYASETLGFENVCNVNLFVVPDLAPAFDAAVARWEELTGKSLTFRIAAATLQDDPTPLMLQARDAGCQAVVIDGVEPHALAVGRAIEAQELQDIIWIGLTSYYTDAIAGQLGSAGNGLQANSERDPGRVSVLTLERISVNYGAVRALDDVSLEVAPGTILGLIGPNGAGKSTLVDAVAGFISGHDGMVTLAGQDIGRLAPRQRARRGVRRSFQQSHVPVDLSIGGYLDLASGHSGPPLTEALAHFGLPPATTPVRSLDVGTRRILEVCGTVVSRPRVVLLDEPAAGLAGHTRERFVTALAAIPSTFGSSVLLIEHDLDVVAATCERVIVLNFGRVIADGPPDEVLTHPAVVAAYLGASNGGAEPS